MGFLVVFIGAGIGGAMRHGVNLFAAWLTSAPFPVGTLTINVVGSFLMGLLAGYFSLRGEASQLWRLFFTTGILGGFTTFSAFSLETVLLYERGQITAAALYVAASVLLSLAGLIAGLILLRA